VTVDELAHAQRQFDEHHEHSRHRIADLEDQLARARRAAAHSRAGGSGRHRHPLVCACPASVGLYAQPR
jgi:hypothetical protein